VAFNEKYVTVTGGGLHDGSSEANAWTLAEAVSNYAAGDRLNVKAGTYSDSSTVTFATAGTAASPVSWRGYKTAIGDLDTHPTTQRVSGTDCPLFTNSVSSGAAYSARSYQSFEQIHFTSATVGTVFDLGYQQNNIKVIGCRVESTTTSTGYVRAVFGNGTNYIFFSDCYFSKNSTADTCVWAYGGSQWRLNRCTIVGASVGFQNTYIGFNGSLNSCVFSGQGATSCLTVGHLFLSNCSFHDCSGDFIEKTSTSSLYVSNCVFSDCGGYAINNSGGNIVNTTIATDNTYHDSSFTSGRLNNIPDDFYAKVDTASPFVDAANGDFTIATTSNGYNNQYLLEKSDISSYMDGGAIQHVSIVDPTTSESTGTQIYPFRQWAQQDPELIIHPLRSN